MTSPCSSAERASGSYPEGSWFEPSQGYQYGLDGPKGPERYDY